MIDPEAQGVLARISQCDREIALSTADMKTAKAAHWKRYYEDQLFAALRRRDDLVATLDLISKEGRKTK